MKDTTENLLIRKVDYNFIKRFSALMKREQVDVKYYPTAKYLGGFIDGVKIAGWVGWQPMKNTDHIRFKTDYVMPDYRRKGIYRRLFDERMVQVLELKPKKLSAYCTEKSLPLFLTYGFEYRSQNRITYVTKEIGK